MQVVGNSGQSITFDTFKKVLEELAARQGCSAEELMSKVSSAEPANTGTQAEPNKFHDDKNLYTGVHKCARVLSSSMPFKCKRQW